MNHYRIRQSITDRSSISVNLYLKEVSKYGLLTSEEEQSLLQEVKKGDKQAKDKLIKSNLRFVISIAKQYQNKGIDFADLIEYGNIGLIKAVDKFDETRGFKFISYAVWWIRQSILEALAEQSKLIKCPLNYTTLLNKINKFITNFEQQNEYKPSIAEIAEGLNLDTNRIKEVLLNMPSVSSLDMPTSDHSEDSFADLMPAELVSSDSNEALRFDINQCLTCLNSIEKQVVSYFFGIGCTQKYIEDIAEELNITKERVRQIKDKAIFKIRKSGQLANLAKYLG